MHPGDINYRLGHVSFEEGRGVELESLWQMFAYFDPERNGTLSGHNFHLAANEVERLASKGPIDAGAAWASLGGEAEGHVGFVRFASWVVMAGVSLPVGLDSCAGAPRLCRAGRLAACACSCDAFRAVREGSEVCACGHRAAWHRSEAAEQALGAHLASASSRPPPWVRGTIGLVEVADRTLLAELQFLLDATHKESDNWTRDRGCMLHGVNACPLDCIMSNRAHVPIGYELWGAFRNQNAMLWARYSLMRSAISLDCSIGEGANFRPIVVESGKPPFDKLDAMTLSQEVNEWRLFHGSSEAACRGICATNFQLEQAGTGATWRDGGVAKGVPLYGHGVYFAERVTKADEYAQASSVSGREELRYMLVCRVVGGRANVCTSNQIDPDALRRQVFHGPHHSVFGDRVRELGKPYREVVIYDSDQIYPEFLLIYRRIF